MKRIFTTILLSVTLLSAEAQIEKLAGPRVGVTMITPGSLASIIRGDVSFFSDEVRQEWTGSTGKYGAAISQYGWQWESRFADGGGDVVGIVEWIALVSGMEKGRFAPSLTSVVGARTSNGFEVGVGPSLSLGGVGMVFAIGKNFQSGSLNMPVNLVFMPGKDVDSDKFGGYTYNSGARISLMVGFNLAK